MHDSPDGTEKADVGAGRSNRGQERQILLEPLLLAQGGDAHRAASAFDHRLGIHVRLLREPREFLEAGPENTLDAQNGAAVAGALVALAVEGGEVDAGPELLLE